MDYDQLCKSLLQTMFGDFMRLFFPQIAERLMLDAPEWLPTEMFVAPPEGERRYPDLIAKVRLKNGKAAVIVIHLEIQERRDPGLGKRMHDYYTIVRIETGCEVFSVALQFHREPDAKAAIERAVYTEFCLGQERLRFYYHRILVPMFWAEEYTVKDNPVGWAIATRMKKQPELTDKEIILRIVQKLKGSTLTDDQIQAVWNFAIGSVRLTRQEVMEVKQVIEREKVNRIITWSDWQFMEGQRQSLVTLLETRFGPLPEVARARIDELLFEELDEAIQKAATAESLEATDLLKPKPRRPARTKKDGKQ